MPERDGQLAIDFATESLKAEGKVNLANALADRKTAFGGRYKDVDEDAIIDAWTNLFIDGWIGPDPDQSSGDWFKGWLRITSYGKTQLGLIENDCYPVFLDPKSTIQELQKTIPHIAPLALRYFEEALWAIKKHLDLSATITMGGASESSILSLIDAVIDYYEDPTLNAAFSKNDKIKPKFDYLLETMKNKKLQKDLLSIFSEDRAKCDNIREIFINIDTTLRRMFDIYSINRNDAGHPNDMGSDPDITRCEAAMFRKFFKTVYGLISCINEAKCMNKGVGGIIRMLMAT
jgi:hypothetical protein